ncbi:hypothetical protein NIES4074_21390 [Cylindrospermum sp. NIES-4074]|nr:hypothetical protein NIES4074_21390 [Cylindrospermum sp. NIES-4074]
MSTYKLNRIVFNDGTTIDPGNLTVIIGPNNSGKSRALKDIAFQATEISSPGGVIVTDVEFTLPQNFQDFDKKYDLELTSDIYNKDVTRLRTLDAKLCERHEASIYNPLSFISFAEWLESAYQREGLNNVQFFRKYLAQGLIAFLT